ncbi:unnamed protein product [Porites lobata]|uniref:N-acetyltransferase domain-containing protein n=1 Tax=Porites lobata TaxID=104759 RepID=A0ABN8N0J9_9CNID|nr:unnamed protein product [Porites lobata]
MEVTVINATSADSVMAKGFWYSDGNELRFTSVNLLKSPFPPKNVKYNEAYISFVLVHPEWRRGGIGTYMIYHLIQTCLGKDVTLHVSVTNPAILMYQKFGFKPEEFIRDFYNRYLPNDSPQCRHAFFLRLRR